MAGSSFYDKKTRSKLNRLFQKRYHMLKGANLAEILEKKNILEVMAGCGRLIPVYNVYKPKTITIVDISSKSIEFARNKFP